MYEACFITWWGHKDKSRLTFIERIKIRLHKSNLYFCIYRTPKTGKTKFYAIYNDTKNDISELIPVSQTVMSYIKMCEENKIKPSLGIKLRNGQISSIIRYKNRYYRKH